MVSASAIYVWQSPTDRPRVSSITSVSWDVLHFNCILKVEASHTELPLRDSVWSLIDLFIIHSLLTSEKNFLKLLMNSESIF